MSCIIFPQYSFYQWILILLSFLGLGYSFYVLFTYRNNRLMMSVLFFYSLLQLIKYGIVYYFQISSILSVGDKVLIQNQMNQGIFIYMGICILIASITHHHNERKRINEYKKILGRGKL
jgi:hypothetical protein